MIRPFIVLALPRSMTAWLARALSYGDWHCGHDEALHLRAYEDITSWLSQPCTGTVETAAAPFWRTAITACPGIRIVTIRRPVEEVVDSLLRTGACTDREAVTKAMMALDAKLDQIEHRVPGVLSVTYEDLKTEDGFRRVFEFCLPYQHDHGWWEMLAPVNIQINLPHQFRRYQAHKPQIDRLAAILHRRTLVDLDARPLREPDEFVVRVEPFEDAYRDCKGILSMHRMDVGEHPYTFEDKNIDLMRALDAAGSLQTVTVRSNGRMVGYLMTVIGPSLEDPQERVATHTALYADPDYPGAGRTLQRAAKAALVEAGVEELVLRAGTRADGPRLEALYRRMGAEDHGRLYKLRLKDK